MKKTVGVIQEGFSEEVLYEMNLKMRRASNVKSCGPRAFYTSAVQIELSVMMEVL